MPKRIMSLKWPEHQANNEEVMEMLGLSEHRLPKEGMPEQVIQGVRVYVKPFEKAAFKSSKHRIMAICACGRHMGVSRLQQHKCHMDAVNQILGEKDGSEQSLDGLAQHKG